MSAPSHQTIAGPSFSSPSLLHSPTATPTLAPLIPSGSRRRRSLSTSSTDDQEPSSQTQSDTQPSDSPPTAHRRVLKRARLIQGGGRPDQELGQPSPPPLTTAAPSSTPPATLPLTLPGAASSSSASPGASDRRGRRQPLRPTTRPVRVQNPIIIDSSDSSDEDEVMASVLAPPAEIVGGSRPVRPNPSPNPRSRRRIMVSSDSSPLTAANLRADPDSSGGDILVQRVIRRPPPIQVLDDSLQDEEVNAPRTTASALSAASMQALNGSASPPIVKPPLRQVQASPPRSKPLPVANPLMSKFICPICLSTPWPHVVATPCGHVYCSACLFQALQAPVKARQDAVREQMAAFSSLSALQRAGLPASATAPGPGPGPGPQHRPHPGTTTAVQNTTPSQLSNSATTGAGTETTQTTHAPTRTSMSTTTTTTNTANTSNTVIVTAPRTSTTAVTSTSTSTSPPRPKVNQLVGTCPFCRAEIPGGFIAGAGPATSSGPARASAKRPVFGLEIKIGRPFDDPRRVKG